LGGRGGWYRVKKLFSRAKNFFAGGHLP